mmetsp:Transcript_74551/g.216254  ORF Transcript_74551/g.216254 Transcript_74551/m.216254 type:complete len:231 (+) Transcript_74551:346-1038(+)
MGMAPMPPTIPAPSFERNGFQTRYSIFSSLSSLSATSRFSPYTDSPGTMFFVTKESSLPFDTKTPSCLCGSMITFAPPLPLPPLPLPPLPLPPLSPLLLPSELWQFTHLPSIMQLPADEAATQASAASLSLNSTKQKPRGMPESSYLTCTFSTAPYWPMHDQMAFSSQFFGRPPTKTSRLGPPLPPPPLPLPPPPQPLSLPPLPIASRGPGSGKGRASAATKLATQPEAP